MAFVVFAGQSNMGGPFQNGSSLLQPWRPDPLTQIWDPAAGAWEQMQPGVNTGYPAAAASWGPEVQFALDFRAAFPNEPLQIVKAVWGGTSLAADTAQWHYDWSPASAGELFDQTTAMVRAAGAALGGATPSGLLWGQGEEDANIQAAAQAYGGNLQALFAAARQAWLNDPSGKIAYFQIGHSPPFSDLVRQGEAAVDQLDPNATSFDAGGFPHQGDDLHYSAQGLDMAGDGFFAIYAGWRGAGLPPTGGPAPVTVVDPNGAALNGTPGDDSLTGGVGPDSLAGGAGHDVMRGGDGADRMSGGDGFDDMNGNAGDDTLAGDGGDDWVVGGKGNDVLFGDEGNDIVYGNLGSDTCDGGAGADLIRGGQGDDVLTGGVGDDWLSGDIGSDTMTGGPGADIFHISPGAGLDRVTDFNASEGDHVQLDAGAGWSVAQVGADTVVSLDGAQLVLANVTLSALPPGWLIAV